MDAQASKPARDPAQKGEGHRWLLVAFVPLMVIGAFFLWLFLSGALDGLRGAHADHLREERALLGLDATPGADQGVLTAALGIDPKDWDARTRGAVAGLLARADWPPSGPAGAGRLLADRAPTAWSVAERDAVRELLIAFRRKRMPSEAGLTPAW